MNSGIAGADAFMSVGAENLLDGSLLCIHCGGNVVLLVSIDGPMALVDN